MTENREISWSNALASIAVSVVGLIFVIGGMLLMMTIGVI